MNRSRRRKCARVSYPKDWREGGRWEGQLDLHHDSQAGLLLGWAVDSESCNEQEQEQDE